MITIHKKGNAIITSLNQEYITSIELSRLTEKSKKITIKIRTVDKEEYSVFGEKNRIEDFYRRVVKAVNNPPDKHDVNYDENPDNETSP